MKSRRDFDSALAAEYSLGTLRGAARQRFARRLLQEPELAAEVSRWQNSLAELDQRVVPVPPPEAVWQRIARGLPADKAPASNLRWPWLGWVLAASFAGALLYTQFTAPPAPQAVAVLNGNNQQGSWVVSLSQDKTHFQLNAHRKIIAGLTPLITGNSGMPGPQVERDILYNLAVAADQTVRRHL